MGATMPSHDTTPPDPPHAVAAVSDPEKTGLQSASPRRAPSFSEGEDGSTPTEEELVTLRRVADKVSLVIYLVGAAEVAERFAFRCLTGPLRACPACHLLLALNVC